MKIKALDRYIYLCHLNGTTVKRITALQAGIKIKMIIFMRFKARKYQLVRYDIVFTRDCICKSIFSGDMMIRNCCYLKPSTIIRDSSMVYSIGKWSERAQTGVSVRTKKASPDRSNITVTCTFILPPRRPQELTFMFSTNLPTYNIDSLHLSDISRTVLYRRLDRRTEILNIKLPHLQL